MRTSVGKVVVEVSVDADLLASAGRVGTDLSQAAEDGIRQAVVAGSVDREARRRAWKAKNADAIRSYNEFIGKNGLPLAKYRTF